MNRKVIGIIGSYRRGGITDQVVSCILDSAKQNGMETKKIYLTDYSIKFCLNCRVCTQTDPHKIRGDCIHNDDMDQILKEIDNADGLILASPINFSTVTAIMKRFIERLIVYVYWPWGKIAPQKRIKKLSKKAIIVTSSSCPALIGRIIMPNCLNILKNGAKIAGAKVVKSLYFGGVCYTEKQKLTEKQLRKVKKAGAIFKTIKEN
ncbi:MAG: flavodoxin family protein [bacterium]